MTAYLANVCQVDPGVAEVHDPAVPQLVGRKSRDSRLSAYQLQPIIDIVVGIVKKHSPALGLPSLEPGRQRFSPLLPQGHSLTPAAFTRDSSDAFVEFQVIDCQVQNLRDTAGGAEDGDEDGLLQQGRCSFDKGFHLVNGEIVGLQHLYTGHGYSQVKDLA